MNNSVKPVKYSIYDPCTTFLLPIMLALFCALSIGLSIFFLKRFLLHCYDPAVFLLLTVLICPWVYVFVNLHKNGLLLRLLLRLYFDEHGIHCSLFGKEKYMIEWGQIHTFGTLGYSFSWASGMLILFSTDKKELAPKNTVELNQISRKRMIIRYRPEVWEALMEVIPADMREKLNYAFSRKQDCFHKR